MFHYFYFLYHDTNTNRHRNNYYRNITIFEAEFNYKYFNKYLYILLVLLRSPIWLKCYKGKSLSSTKTVPEKMASTLTENDTINIKIQIIQNLLTVYSIWAYAFLHWRIQYRQRSTKNTNRNAIRPHKKSILRDFLGTYSNMPLHLRRNTGLFIWFITLRMSCHLTPQIFVVLYDWGRRLINKLIALLDLN